MDDRQKTLPSLYHDPGNVSQYPLLQCPIPAKSASYCPCLASCCGIGLAHLFAVECPQSRDCRVYWFWGEGRWVHALWESTTKVKPFIGRYFGGAISELTWDFVKYRWNSVNVKDQPVHENLIHVSVQIGQRRAAGWINLRSLILQMQMMRTSRFVRLVRARNP